MQGSGRTTPGITQGTRRVTSPYVLEASGLTKRFAGFIAVNDVNLRVKRGSIHALIGPNGAG